jgi:rare lipoprotein A
VKRGLFSGVLVLVVLLAGCSSKKHAKQQIPPLPPPEPPAQTAPGHDKEAASGTAPGARHPEEAATTSIPKDAPVLYSETGIASWYGPPYHNRRGANGEVYDMNALTAAHKTLPLNSLVRVTNVKTGDSTVVRITDRGPFVGDRIIDLSMAAAKAVDVWRPGTALVRVDVLSAPAPITTGGKWAVQIGAFQSRRTAAELKSKLMRRYHTAQILQFTGPTGEWVRVRVQDDDKRRAQELAQATVTPEGGIFLVRLD